MRFFVLALTFVLIAACKALAPSEPQPTHSDSLATAASIGHLALPGQGKAADSQATPHVATSTVDLSQERKLIDESEAARKAADYATARVKIAEVVTSLIARPESEQDAAWLELLYSAGVVAYNAQDMHVANIALQRVFDIRSRTLPDDHPDLQKARGNLALTIKGLGDPSGARTLLEKVLEVQSRTLPDDHPDLQMARGNLALTIKDLGDLPGARALQEKVLEVRLRTLPDDHPDLQRARQSFASTILQLGDLSGARALFEKVFEVRSRTLPDDHPDLQLARRNLAVTMKDLGDLPGARALEEKVLDVLSRTLPEDHPELQRARQNLAGTMYILGDLSGAQALFGKVLEALLRTLPSDHHDLQVARQNLATTIMALGNLSGARNLFESVLEVYSRTLPDYHPDLQAARQNLAITIEALGDLAGARALEEKVLEIRSAALPDDHPDLQSARQNLATTIEALGDPSGARVFLEKVLDVRSRTLPDDHPDLQAARHNLAVTMEALGDLSGARALEEKVLEVFSRTRPADDIALQKARGSLAKILGDLGDLTGAQALEEKVLEVDLRTLPDDHPDLQTARTSLAATRFALGDLGGARALFEKVLEVDLWTLPDDHPHLQIARKNLACAIASQCARANHSSGGKPEITRASEIGRESCADLIGALCRAQVRAAHNAILGSPGREAEERCSTLAKTLDVSLSFASGYGVFEPLRTLEAESFVLAEATRGAAIVSAELTHKAASAPKCGELRDSLRAASDCLAGLSQKGTTSEDFDHARLKRESLENELVALARELSGGKDSGVEINSDSLARRLAEHVAAVGFRRFVKTKLIVAGDLDSTGQPAVRETLVDSLCAFIARSSKTSEEHESSPVSPLTLVDLGPIGPIEDAVRAWRDDLGVASDSRGVAVGAGVKSSLGTVAVGATLRKLVFDPLLPSLAGTQRIVVALDDVLNLVPLNALPFDESNLLGDRWQIETRATLSELLGTPEALAASGKLVEFGDIDYGTERPFDEAGAATQLASAKVAPRSDADAGILRGGSWSGGFPALPGTGDEVRGIARCFADQSGADAAPELCDHATATRELLMALAPKARFLHIATHGWFAPESIKSWSDPEPLDKRSGLGMRLSGEVQVRGMSPMLLCGLALAGANMPITATGRVPGLVTAEELSTLDLTNCELVVLSACDTNVGERRAGQGVHSLQMALQMAGARSVITSLWKVPDEATKVLMLDFYRRLWVERKPKWQALWEAKMKIRNQKDESGQPRYTTRDWAAWILTGDPN